MNVDKALEVARASEWTGDPRTNLLTMHNAGLLLAKEIERLRAERNDRQCRLECAETALVNQQAEIERLRAQLNDCRAALIREGVERDEARAAVERLRDRVSELTKKLGAMCRADCCDKAELVAEIERLRLLLLEGE